MNAGRDLRKAVKRAQANANATKSPRWVHRYGGCWWISKTPVEGGGKINPQPVSLKEEP